MLSKPEIQVWVLNEPLWGPGLLGTCWGLELWGTSLGLKNHCWEAEESPAAADTARLRLETPTW